MLSQLQDKLRQSRLSTHQTTMLATELLGEEFDAVAAVLFSLLKREPAEDTLGNTLDLFRELATRNPAWARILQKSVTKHGRCPKPLRSSVKTLLSAQHRHLATETRSLRRVLTGLEGKETTEEQLPQVASGAITERTRSILTGRRTIVVKLTTELTHIDKMHAVASLLHSLVPPPDELIFDCAGVEHLYICGLAALATWCKEHNIRPKLKNQNSQTDNYLDAIGFLTAASDAPSNSASLDPKFAMALRALNQYDSPDRVARDLVTIIDSRMHLSRKGESGLMVLFSELIENIYRHGGNPKAAFACAQVYPKKNMLSVCIIDDGMGVGEPIRTGSNKLLRQRLEQGDSALRLACAPLNTSKPDRHSGYGLYVSSELVVRNGGQFCIFSGNEILALSRTSWRRKEYLGRSTVPWRGTWISMIIDLNSTLSIEDVYITLPASPGVQEEDFFNYAE